MDENAAAMARRADLTYVTDSTPGVRRRRCGRGFTYVDGDGEFVHDEELRERIDDLAVPPGWTEVWICRRADGHIQATGRDEEGRKQYIYHPRWRRARERQKYERLAAFGARLPVLRQRVGRHLAASGVDRRRVAAAAIRLLDRASMRVGNESYTEDNGSFGVTTLRKRHVEIRSSAKVSLQFIAKSGRERDVEVQDEALVEVLRDLRHLSGENLFVYRNGTGPTALHADDVNEYLRSVTDQPISAKDFRTWRGSVRALEVLLDAGDLPEDERHAVVIRAADAVAELLGNTRATARDFYVPPGLFQAYEAGRLESLLERARRERPQNVRPGFRRGEPLLLALLPHLEDDLDR